MHILMVNSHGNDTRVGGAEKGIDLLAEGLLARGHSVSVLAAFPGSHAIGAGDAKILRHDDWRRSELVRARSHIGDWLSLPRQELVRGLADIAPDVVHTHNLPGIGGGIWEVCRRLRVPAVHTLHDYHLLCPRVTLMQRDGTTPCAPSRFLCGARSRRLSRFTDAVSVVAGVSAHVLDVHADLFPNARRCLVRNPLAIPSWRAMRPPSPTLRTVGYIGNLDPIKGLRLLLAAIPTLTRLGIGVRIAGSGRMADEVRAAADRYPSVRYHGIVGGDEKEDFFEECDLGVIPSVWAEPGGPTHTMIEWLSSGRPALVSRRGGLGEVVDDYGGSIAIEPTVEGILATIGSLASAENWAHAVDAVTPIVADEHARWVETYESIYLSAGAGGAASHDD